MERALLASAILSATLAVSVFSQGQPALSFDAASVKTNRSRTDRTFRFSPQRLDISGSTLAYIVSQAYEMPIPRTVYPPPPMTDLLRGEYDIHATADRPSTRPELLQMLQRLLRERFALAVHTERRTGPAYSLVAARGGSKLRKSEQTFEETQPRMGIDFLEGRANSVGQLAFLLTARMGRPVIDRTGLVGLYDFRLQLESMDERPGRDPKAAAEYWSESSVFTDIQEQLGLRLEGTNAAVDYLVIDKVAAPTEN